MKTPYSRLLPAMLNSLLVSAALVGIALGMTTLADWLSREGQRRPG